MATNIVMPNLGFDSQSGQVIEWYKSPGDVIKKGETLALIEADKSNVELESITGGILLETLVPLGEDIEIGQVIARIGTEAEYKAIESAQNNVTASSQVDVATLSQTTEAELNVSPVARRMADANQIELSDLKGSGARGRIMREDVEAHITTRSKNGAAYIPMALPKVRKAAREAGIDLAQLGITGRPITMADLEQSQSDVASPAIEISAELEPSTTTTATTRNQSSETKLSRMRQTIGRRLVASKQQAPHFYVTGEFDLTDALTRLIGYKAKVNDLLQYLTVQALLEVPELNATFEDDTIYHYDHVNLAIAVALDSGLMTPVLHKADHYSLNGMAEQSRELVKRTRAGKIQPNEMQGGTFTISNLGIIRQVTHFTAILNPPQVGILAVGTVKERPVVINGGFHARHTVNMTLSGDHRVVDGMHLGRFMAAYQSVLDHFTR